VEQQTSDATVSLSSFAHFPAWVNDFINHEAAVEHGGASIPATRRASSLEPLTRLEPCHESRAWERTSFAPQKPPARHARDAREFGGGAGGLCKVIRVSPKVRRSG
jgi:hypothetical protein